MTKGNRCCIFIPINQRGAKSLLNTEPTNLHNIFRWFEEYNLCVLKLDVATKFTFMKQIVLYINCTLSTMSSFHSNFFKISGCTTFLTRVIKNELIFCFIIFQRVNELKVHTLNAFDVFDFFLHLLVKRLEILIKENDSVKVWLESVIFQPFVYKLWFSRLFRAY